MQHPADLLLYLAMGLCCGILSLCLMAMVFGLPRLYQKTPLPRWSLPACGGLVVGFLGLFWPSYNFV